MFASTIRHCVLFAVLGALPAVTYALPSRYHLQDLGPGSDGEYVNAPGQVAGFDDSQHQGQPAIWTNGVATDLADPFEGGLAWEMNVSGAAIGQLIDENRIDHAIFWPSPNVAIDLGAQFLPDYSFGTAINDNGDCTIDVSNAEGAHTYFSKGCTDANLQDIGSLGWGDTSSVALNAHGQIAGISFAGSGSHPYLYTAGAMKDLGVLSGCSDGLAKGLNAHGHVVGYCQGPGILAQGFFYNGKKLISLGALGGRWSRALSINSDDVIVGSAKTADRSWHPFVFDKGTKGTTMMDLSDMLDSSGAGWSLVVAVSINASGQILVQGYLDGDTNPRSALLTPLP
jgi:probable HAF family extracellular repeat protein